MAKSRKRVSNSPEQDGQYEQAAASNRPMRHKDLWFRDGSIVLSVENVPSPQNDAVRTLRSFCGRLQSPATTWRRCDRWLPSRALARQIWGFPAFPQSFVWSIVSTIRATHQSTASLNDIYYHYRSYLSNRHSKVDCDRVTSILRISTKYEMAMFRNQCILELKQLYPSSLNYFDAVYSLSGAPWTFQTKEDEAVNFAKVFDLVHELNVPEILPCAFYFWTQLDVSTILATLSKGDSAACLVGRDRLQKMQHEQTYGFVLHFPSYDQCQCCGDCKQQMDSMVTHFHRTKGQWTDLNPYTIQLADFSVYRDGSICAVCLKGMEKDHQNARKKVWDNLPGIFGLGTWEELRTAQMLDTSSSDIWSVSILYSKT